MNTHYSLRRRLLGWISIPILTATLLAMLVSFAFTWHEIEEVYDAQMVHSAKVLLQLTQHEILEDEGFHLGLENPELYHRYERELGFRVWLGNEVLTQSPSTKSFSDFEGAPGFSNHKINDHTWRVFVFLDPVHKIKIEVSERYDIRYELIIQLMSALIIPSLIFIPIIFLVIWVGVRKVLKPIIKISSDVDRRSSDDLSPIHENMLPQEIAPLIEALNRLFVRIEDSFKREREFTDHAAHELRTPLAAMKTQTQVLLKKTAGLPQLKDGLDNLQSSIDRAAHMVEQLLSLARLQNETIPLEKVNLSQCLHEAIEDMKDHAQQKSIKITSSIDENVMVSGHADSLEIMLRNLLDNAVKYTPEEGKIRISLAKQGIIEIADTGPGLGDEDKIRVFERFVRLDKTGQTGSGLGLPIVKWVTEAHGAALSLHDNPPKGLLVRLKMEPVS